MSSREKTTSNQKPIEQPVVEAPTKAVFGVSNMAHTFESFDHKRKGVKKAYDAFYELAEGRGNPFLLCYGGVGNGKTHLLEATAIRLGERGVWVTVWVFADFLSYLRRMIPDPMKSVDAIVENYQTRGAVFFDDVGVEYGTDWERSILERIISGRFRSKSITVLTTNKDLDEVDDRGRRFIPERVASRFFDPDIGTVVLNSGSDFRRMKGGK